MLKNHEQSKVKQAQKYKTKLLKFFFKIKLCIFGLLNMYTRWGHKQQIWGKTVSINNQFGNFDKEKGQLPHASGPCGQGESRIKYQKNVNKILNFGVPHFY